MTQKAIWSLLDQKGTQTMMKSVLGDAAQLADYDTVKNRMKSSRYTMDFQNGVKFDMAVVMSDTVTAATAATLLKGVALLRKNSGSSMEKTALDEMTIDSNSGTLTVDYASVGQPVFGPADVSSVSVGGEVSGKRERTARGSRRGLRAPVPFRAFLLLLLVNSVKVMQWRFSLRKTHLGCSAPRCTCRKNAPGPESIEAESELELVVLEAIHPIDALLEA